MAPAAWRRRSSTPEPDQGGDHEGRGEWHALIEALRQAEQRFRAHDIDLVEGEHRAAGGAEACQDGLDLGVEPGPAVDQQDDQIGIAGTAPGGLDHGAVEVAARREDARRVDEDDLATPLDRDAAQACPGGLNLVGDDRRSSGRPAG